ncbi:uncharacterized protein JCM10292_005105 [Rhodotorula paludigena]|uniref:uncharacterized protein n=1 Tax=Rhodotorula paludigena TaxID=86838 RepID=UPI00316FBFC7
MPSAFGLPEWLYQSAIPLAPTSTSASLRRTSFTPPTTHFSAFPTSAPNSSPPLRSVPPHLTERPERPDMPRTPQLGSTPVTGDAATFQQVHYSPTEDESPTEREAGASAISPPRPRRPDHPDQALMFNAPLPALPSSMNPSDEGDLRRPSTPPNAARTLVFPSPPHSGLLPALPASSPSLPAPRSPRSPRRKPVPQLLDNIQLSPRSAAPSPSPEPPATPGRLSIGGFEALVESQRGAPTEGGAEEQRRSRLSQLQADEANAFEDDGGRVVWSPRIHLGLDAEGVEAREERRRWDELHRRHEEAAQEQGGQDLGDARRLASYLEPSTSGAVDEHTLVSPRGTRSRVRQITVDSLAPPAVASPPRSPRSPRTPPRSSLHRAEQALRSARSAKSRHTRMTSYEPAYLSDDDAEVEEVQAGPRIRRGSKRLSELPSISLTDTDDDDERHQSARTAAAADGADQATDEDVSAARPARRRPSLFSMLSSPVRSMRRPSSERRKPRFQRAVRTAPEVEVVVHDSSRDSSSSSEAEREKSWLEPMDGDWERLRRETTCRPERMDWSMCDFQGWFPRFLHLLYPFAIFAHVPVTVFLDYNVLYLLCQLALYPSLPATRNIASRALVGVPDIEASTGWWVAVGVYATCTALWFFVVFLWKELGRDYFAHWSRGGQAVEIEKVYAGAASYNLACVRSYSVFSFLWRVRLAPFHSASPIAQAVEGSTWLDGVKETSSWYRQNWPTVLLLLPRAGITVAVLLLYSTTAYGSTTTATTERDSAYFDSDGTLSAFASGVLLANAAWAAWRLALVLVAAFASSLAGFSFFGRRRADSYSAYFHSSREHLAPAHPDSPDADKTLSSRRPSIALATWRTRRQRRLRSAILACVASTPLSVSTPTFSPFLAKSPYVLGYSSSAFPAKRPLDPWSSATESQGSPAAVHAHERSALDSHKRRATLSQRGAALDPAYAPGGPMMVARQPQPTSFLARAASYVLPRPDAAGASPLIHFSPATPSPPRVPVATFASASQASGVQPRRASQTVGFAGCDAPESDLGESRLHRRMSSRPFGHDEDEDASAVEHLAPAVLPSQDVALPPGLAADPPRAARPVLPTLTIDASSPPRQLYPPPTSSTLSRPPLVSHFSAFSSKPVSSSSSQLSLSSPRVDRSTVALDSAAALEAQLRAGHAERQRLSARLQDEVRAARDEVDAHDAVEQSAARIERLSPDEAAADDSLYSAAATARPRPDRLDTVSERSSLGLGSSVGAGAVDEGQSAPSTVRPRNLSGPPVLPPFRLSYASGADSLSLSAYGASPEAGREAGGAHETGRFT